MWFQGRDEEIEDEVVSLSTGRIYKASSPDGLKWTLEAGPGTRQASLDVNEEEWWGFDTAHVGLGDVLLNYSDKVSEWVGGWVGGCESFELIIYL